MRLVTYIKQYSGGFVADSGTIMMGTVTSQAINLVALPILARLYTPIDYGETALILSIISVFGVVACGRYELAVLSPVTEREAAQVLMVAIFMSCLISVVVGIGYYTYVLLFPTSHFSVWAVIVGVLFIGYERALSSWALRQRAFLLLAIARASNGIITVIVQITIALLGYASFWGLIVGFVVGYLFSVIILASRLINDRLLIVDSLNKRFLWKSAKRYRKFPLIESWGALLNSAAVQLPVFLLNGFFSSAIVGFYSMAYRIIAAPVTLMAQAVSQVYFQRASELRRHELSLFKFSSKVYVRLLIIGCFPFLFVTLFGQYVFSLLLGPEWFEAGVYAQYLSLGLLFQLAFAPLSFMFIILNKQVLALLVHIFTFIFPLGGIVLGALLAPGSPNLAILLLGASKVLLYILLAYWALILARNYDKRLFVIAA